MVFFFRAIFLFTALFCISASTDWGFYAHRKINRYAVYSLPDPLFAFYKRHQSYLETHAIDADKRRYAVKQEAAFHFIDLDKYYGDSLTKWTLQESRWKYSSVDVYNEEGLVLSKPVGDTTGYRSLQLDTISQLEEWLASLAPERKIVMDIIGSDHRYEISMIDSFTIHGLLPYRLERMMNALERAFVQKDISSILRLSADIGHYVGDAHVPLHTTENYNGQLTNQIGIHGFWESRLPELFHNTSKFIQIRPASYVQDYRQYIWQIIEESHNEVDRVLFCEKTSREKIEEDKLMCFDQRSGAFHWQPCPEYAKAFDKCMGSMVWARWEHSIYSLGSLWYSAWLNAGEPDLSLDLNVSGELEGDLDQRKIQPDRSCQ